MLVLQLESNLLLQRVLMFYHLQFPEMCMINGQMNDAIGKINIPDHVSIN